MVQLFVRGLDGRSRCVELAQEQGAVEDLMVAIEEVEGIPSELQGLVFAGRQLSQGCALAEYGISSGSTVHLCLRLRGGKGGFGALLRGQGRDGKVTTNFDAMRDLQGRRLRHKFAEEKLAEWKAGAKERELEKIAQQHIKELARQQRKQEHEQVDLEAIQAVQEETVARTREAVQDAIAAGKLPLPASKAGAAAAAGEKRKSPEKGEGSSGNDGGSGAAGASGSKAVAAAGTSKQQAPAPKRSKMLAALEDIGSDLSDSDAEDE